jgi:hypothetical protein
MTLSIDSRLYISIFGTLSSMRNALSETAFFLGGNAIVLLAAAISFAFTPGGRFAAILAMLRAQLLAEVEFDRRQAGRASHKTPSLMKEAQDHVSPVSRLAADAGTSIL